MPIVKMLAFLALASLLLLVGCSHNVYAPPSRTMVLTSPETLAKDETSVRGSASFINAIFGPSIAAGSVGVRRGIDEGFEVVGDLSYFQITDESVAGTNRGVGMARGGAKYRFPRIKHLALVAGLGGGLSPAAGSYLSTDAGAVVGYENRYAVPYFSAIAFGSLPLNPKEIDVTEVDDDQTYTDTPEATIGISLGIGLKIPIRNIALHLGLTSTQLRDNDESDAFLSMGAGLESSF